MRISLIVCTRNRADQLRRCLDHLAALDYPHDWELVIVDNGSTDATTKIAAKFAGEAHFPVVCGSEPRAGLSNARNRGIALSRGEILLFTDDDCYVATDLLRATDTVFSDPAIGFASGRILLHDPTDFAATINESTVPRLFLPYRRMWTGAIAGANFAVRRTALKAAGDFDPLFGAGAPLQSAEDTDMAMRLGLAGWAGRYSPEMVVSHHHGRKAADIASLHRGYDLGRGAYHAKLFFQRGGRVPALKAWAGIGKRMRARRSALRWECQGALRYIALRCLRS
jgi:glycosyltransferase involved in cell wall biosynthesis